MGRVFPVVVMPWFVVKVRGPPEVWRASQPGYVGGRLFPRR